VDLEKVFCQNTSHCGKGGGLPQVPQTDEDLVFFSHISLFCGILLLCFPDEIKLLILECHIRT
jgi:hypothetical protein